MDYSADILSRLDDAARTIERMERDQAQFFKEMLDTLREIAANLQVSGDTLIQILDGNREINSELTVIADRYRPSLEEMNYLDPD